MIVAVLLALLVGLTLTVNLGVGLAGACIGWAVYVAVRDLLRGKM
jgi:hypothetical protein